MNEEPLSELTKALDNATTKEMLPLERLTKEEQIFSSEELTNLLMRFMVWLYKKIRMLLIGETALSKTSIDFSTANVDTASAAVSQPSPSVDTASAAVSQPSPSVDTVSAAVPQPSPSVDTDKVTTTSRNSKADGIRDQEVQAVGEFSHLVEARQKTLEKQREERLRQSKQTHRFALGALSIGIMLIFIGVVCIFFLQLPVGIVTAASSIIPGVVSALAFKLNKEVNDRLDSVAEGLSKLEKAGEAMHYISQIEDKEIRDNAIRDLVKGLFPS